MPNDLKNDLDTKDSINNTFISNQLSKTNNIELLKALENGFKLIDLSDDEINIIAVSSKGFSDVLDKSSKNSITRSSKI